MFRDKRLIGGSVSIPHAKLHKICVVLSFHRVGESIAGDIM